MQVWQCIACGFVYNEEDGIPEDGIAPGTKFEDIPDTWVCPDCGMDKSQFELLEF